MYVTNMSDGQGRVLVTEGKSKVDSGLEGVIGRREGRHISVMGGWFYGFCNPFRSGFGHINFVAPVMIYCSAHIKNSIPWGAHVFLLRRPFVDQKFCPRRGERSLIEIK